MPTDQQKPHLSDRGREEAKQRQERLAAALRENLRKRKEQMRGRRQSKVNEPDPEGSG
jgi:hypothetical protein